MMSPAGGDELYRSAHAEPHQMLGDLGRDAVDWEATNYDGSEQNAKRSADPSSKFACNGAASIAGGYGDRYWRHII